MKLLKNILLITLLIVSGACSDYLDNQPSGQLTMEMIFRDKTRTEDWLAGVYAGVPDPYWGHVRHIGYDPLSDDMAPSPRWVQFGWWVVDRQKGIWTAGNTEPNYWNELPKRIRSALIFMENVRPNEAQHLTQADVDNMKYEARFLIAYYYWLMTEMYGVIPFNLEITPNNSSPEQLYIGQKPFDETINWIDGELLELSTKLPASYLETDASKYGKATSIMCLAVRARMLLFAASPLVNGNPDYADIVNDKGVLLYSSSYDAGKWTRATDACKLLIDKAHEGGHKLYYEYNGAIIDPFLSYQNMMFRKESDGNKEILFARPNSDIGEHDRHSVPRGMGGNGGLGVTQSLVDAFFMKNGFPIKDPGSEYIEKGFSSANEIRDTKWNESNGVGQVTLAGTYNMYCNREPRFYISVLYNRAWHRRGNRETRFMLEESDGGPTHDAPASGYLLRKKVHPDYNPINDTKPYRPGILYRLGEAYLNYAEALNESDPGNPEILFYVNKIRERAGIPGLAGGSQSEMREAIRRERRVELNCEGIRYSDIRRWKIGEEVLNGDFWGMNFNGETLSDDDHDPKAFFKRTVYQKRVFTKKNYWFPVPQSEIDKNPNLVQNPFWQ